MMIINLLIQLLACYMDLFCIHNDYIIAGINVRGVLRLVLASQYFSYFRCQTAKGLALCVYLHTIFYQFSRVSHKCFIVYLHTITGHSPARIRTGN